MAEIVIVGHALDEHCDLVEAVLERYDSVEVFQVALADLPSAPSTWSPQRGWTIDGHQLRPGQLSGLFRRPGTPSIDTFDQRYANFVDSECRDAFHGALASLNISWLNSPTTLASAELKIFQIAAARELGVRIPGTLVTNEPNRALDFAGSHSSVIVKPVRYGLLASEPEPLVAWVHELDKADAAGIDGPPVILQERINTIMHIRAVTVGENVFVATLSEVTGVDWRESPPNHRRFVIADEEVAGAVTLGARKISKGLGLGYSSQDWLIDDAGDIIFLEANPNGQWAFLDDIFTQSITECIAARLVELARE